MFKRFDLFSRVRANNDQPKHEKSKSDRDHQKQDGCKGSNDEMTMSDNSQSSRPNSVRSSGKSFRLLKNSVKRTARAPPSLKGHTQFTLLIQGWLIHYTSLDEKRMRQYWRLTTRAVEIHSDIDCKSSACKSEIMIETIKLHDIQSVEECQDENSKAMMIKLVLQHDTFYLLEDTSTNYESQRMVSWLGAFKKALAPHRALSPGSAHNTVPKPQSTKNKNSLTRQKSWNWSLFTDDKSAENLEQIYQIEPDEILGSGQFGIVYSARHRTRHQAVAIKAINKNKFPSGQDQQLRHEVTVISGLDHPGVVKLFNMFETPKNIYVVMEKLGGDMLEMILNNPNGLLDERMAKFLIYQILTALAYLHNRSVVHCDLKPENVLILDTSQALPMIKLCDFGFARIIGEKSFRSSVVGTPAYLPPEVLSNEGYNRSLDMWSVGIIIYVSLSGTFPFNEEEELIDQLANSNSTNEFMFPSDYWSHISDDAILLIKSLLQVQRRKRLSVNKALSMNWLQDFNLWVDLRRTEKRFGQRYLTHESDDERWSDYARRYGKQII